MTETIEILRAAKERLFEKGWIKGEYGGRSGPNCTAGAIILSSSDTNYTRRAYTALHAALDSEYEYNIVPKIAVLQFNDDGETTFDDIVGLFDRAIKNEESK